MRAIVARIIFNYKIFRHAITIRVIVAKIETAHAKLFCISVVNNKKLHSLISMFSRFWFVCGVEQIEKDILLIFSRIAAVSRTFISFLEQLKISYDNVAFRYSRLILKFHFIRIVIPTYKQLFFDSTCALLFSMYSEVFRAIQSCSTHDRSVSAEF